MRWKNIAIVGGIAAAVLGSGGAALAATPSASPSGSNSAGSSPAAGSHDGLRSRLRHAVQLQWVTHDKKTNTDVTHDAIRGQVSAVSATSITVAAANGASETYAVGDSTKVRVKGGSKAQPGSIGDIKTGDAVIVVGTGTSSLSATRILDRS